MEDNNNEFSTELDPAVIKIRDQIIKKIGDKPLEEVNDVIKKLLREQMDEVTRLGALAARVKIIRAKITELYENKKIIKKVIKEKPKSEAKDKKFEEKADDWLRVKMLQSSEVNGKQIDKDVVLDVKADEAKKLIDAKKAEVHKGKPDAKEERKEDKNKEMKTEDKKVEDKKVEEKKVEEKKVEENSNKKNDEKLEEKVPPKKEKVDLSKDLLKLHEEKEKPGQTEKEEQSEPSEIKEEVEANKTEESKSDSKIKDEETSNSESEKPQENKISNEKELKTEEKNNSESEKPQENKISNEKELKTEDTQTNKEKE